MIDQDTGYCVHHAAADADADAVGQLLCCIVDESNYFLLLSVVDIEQRFVIDYCTDDCSHPVAAAAADPEVVADAVALDVDEVDNYYELMNNYYYHNPVVDDVVAVLKVTRV